MNSTGRIWEIDFLRGTVLVLMVFFHLLFDLKEFYNYPVAYNSGVYFYIGKVSAILFIIISAVSSFFSRNNVRRAVKFLVVAFLITIGSHLYNSAYGIKFGIMHFLGVSILLFPLFKNINKYFLLVLGTGIIILGNYLDHIAVANNCLFLFNLTGSSWVSADYYPLFPWFGVFLYGVVLGKILYPTKKSLFKFTPPRDIVSYFGRHTLLIYLIHQPILLLAIGAYVRLIDR